MKAPSEPFTLGEVLEAVSACAPSLTTCALELLLLPGFVKEWNRLRPEFPIVVNAPSSNAVEVLVDKACGVNLIDWTPETRSRFFQFVESHVRRPVEQMVLEVATKELTVSDEVKKP